MKTPRKDLIEDLQQIDAQLDGRAPTTTAIKKHGEYSLTAYYGEFDGIEEMLNAAGINTEPQADYGGTSEQELLDELERLASELGRTPRISDMDSDGKYTGATYYNYFESWNAALQQAELELNQESEISREALINDLQRLNKDSDSHPTTNAIRERSAYSITTYNSEFGGLDEALDAANIEKDEPTRISKAEVIAEIRRLANGDTPPTAAEMDQSGEMSARTCYERFGGWNKAVEAAGYDPNADPPEADREDLLNEIKRLREELGRTPATRDMQEDGKYTATRYFDNFGSWNDAVREAGFEPNNRHSDPDSLRIPESDLLEEIRNVADYVDGRPTAKDMIKYGKYSTKPYYNSFGSWNRAIEIAGYTPFTGTSEDIYSTNELTTEIQRLEEMLGRPPTTEDLSEHGQISTQPYMGRFGSWIVALRHAGIQPTEIQMRRYSSSDE
jgi:hypothetical protein